MRIAIITTAYPKFIDELYSSDPRLADATYSEQLAARNASLFGFADFYSSGFHAHGHEAIELHFNIFPLQAAWAHEQGVKLTEIASLSAPRFAVGQHWRQLLAPFKQTVKPLLRRIRPMRVPSWQMDVLSAQIASFRPDIIYNQEPAALPSYYLKRLRAPDCRVVGQIASALPAGEDYRAYDLMVSSLPNFVQHFRRQGMPSAYSRLAFEPAVRDSVGRHLRDIPVSFVGNFSSVHKRRIALLEAISGRVPLALWGAGIERLPPRSPLHRYYRGPAWGRTMLEILARSQITLNNHEEIAAGHANNLRLYEATGMGSLLLTDCRTDLHEAFVPNEEIAAYDNPEDCVHKIETYLADTARRQQIAEAGLRRTDKDHSYFRRTGELLQIFEDVLRDRARLRWLD